MEKRRRVSKLGICRDDLERRENVAKRLNKTATNRLRQDHELLQGSHDFLANEISQDIKRLQHDLKGIREIGNYNVEENSSSVGIKRKRKLRNNVTLFQQKTKSNSRRKLNQNEGSEVITFNPENTSKVISVKYTNKTGVTDLFHLQRTQSQPRKTQTRDFDIQHDVTLEKHETKFYKREGVNGHETDEHQTLPCITNISTNSTTHESSKLCELDV